MWEIMGFTLIVVATDGSRRNLVQWPQWKLSLSISTFLDYLRWQSLSEPSQTVIFSLPSEAPRGHYLHAYYHSTHYNGMSPACVHVSLSLASFPKLLLLTFLMPLMPLILAPWMLDSLLSHASQFLHIEYGQ